jgi:hypothetical protein
MRGRVVFSLAVALAGACGPNSPTPITTVTVPILTVRYERDRPFDPSATGFMTLQIFHKTPGDEHRRTATPFCFLKPVGDGTFGCLDRESAGSVFTFVPVGLENTVSVSDPAMQGGDLSRSVATRIWINGQLITRITRHPDGDEYGSFVYSPFNRTTFR